MPTISGLRKRGYTPESLKKFVRTAGVAKRENIIEIEDFRIIQGGLEGSNVDPMVEMVQLLETQRNFESTQRAVRTIDEILLCS